MLQRFFKLDWVLLLAVFALVGISLISLYSITSSQNLSFGENVFAKQLIFAFLGAAIMFVVALSDYRYFKAYSRLIYFSTIIVLLLVIICGTTVRGTSGWIGVGIFRIQPVEFTKIALIVFLASFISKKKTEIGETGQIIASFVLTAIVVFLVMKQPDFGSAMVLVSIWIGMIFLSGVNKKIIFIIVLAGLIISASSWYFFEDYQKARIMNIFRPEMDKQGSGYNVYQSIVAVGSGGLAGKGIGKGSQSQLNFLPEKHTDFIYAVVAEEWGLIGSLLTLFLYLIIFYRIKRIADFAPDNFAYLSALGIMIMLFVQLFINVGMNIGIVPVAGITLPFLSYGGSSLLAVFASVGILLNIYLKRDITVSRVVESY